MHYLECLTAFVVAVAATSLANGTARAFDDSLYPPMNGRWTLVTGAGASTLTPFDPTKPPGLGQQAPLTPEYLKKFEATLAERTAKGLDNAGPTDCMAPGMPMMMGNPRPFQVTVLPETTYILIDYIHETQRRIFTDGRPWPKRIEPTYAGYSIGTWTDEDGDGRYDVLEAETRAFKGPRFYDASGIPLDEDNESIVKERLYLDKADRNLLHDEITVFDHALTRPWMVTKTYRRALDPLADWPEYICNEKIPFIHLDNDEVYKIGDDGRLAPSRPNQPPPDVRFFTPPK